MPKLGLSSLIVAAAIAAPVSLRADCESKKAEKTQDKGVFGASFFGEGGGQTPPMTPDQADYCESASRQTGEQAGPPPEEDQEEPLPDYVDKVPASTRRFKADDVRNIPRRWPGPRRRLKNSRTKRPPNSILDDHEELRDAPAAASRYSLWANLSTPLLLPASKTSDVSLDDAKVLGREDYDAHILSKGEGSDSSVVPVINPSMALPSRSGLSAVPVTIELDIRETPGEYRDAVAALSRDTGFKMDARFEPRFLGTGQGKVSMRGWLELNKLREVMSREEVLLVEAERAGRSSMRRGGLTDILVGVRIPMQSSPTEALKVTVGRLAENAGFQLIRTIGYQRIPGTSKMVLIVLGRVPVRRLSRVMADPSVVKIASAPGKMSPRDAAVRRSKRGASAALPFPLPKNPIFLALFLMLASLILLRRKLRR